MQWWMWLTASGLFVVAEILTVDLLFASLAFATLMAAGASALSLNALTQGLIFALSAGLSIFILRPIALRNLQKRTPGLATNVDALFGADAYTMTEVNENSGEVKLSGEVWSARSRSGAIEKSMNVKVIAIEGATAIVTREGV
jgi:membrane protein implicated in regulation of membrane protease activity